MYSIFKTFVLSLLMIAQVHFAYAQNAAILPPAMTTFFSRDGKPLTSGTVDFYIPGTNTRKLTWQDADATTPNTNPVVLDAAGRALILGNGAYRQVVKDRNGNIQWDRVTNSAGAGGSGEVTVGDGNAVGTIVQFSGFVAPANYAFTYGQELSRTTYADLLTAVTLTQNITCVSGSATLTTVSDTTQLNVGAAVEAACVPAGATVLSKTASTVTLTANATVSTTTSAIFYPWGNGNGLTTFNVPDLRGVVLPGRNNMGGAASAKLSAPNYTDPNALGGSGGSQSKTLLASNLPPYTPAGSISTGTFTQLVGTTYNTTGISSAVTGISTTGLPSNVNITAQTFTGTAALFGGIATSATVGAGGSGYSAGTQLLTVAGGTCTTQPQFNVTVAAGAITAPVLVTAGECSVAPSNPAVTTGGGGTGGTLNIIYSAAPFSLIQPSKTINYIIKISPDINLSIARCGDLVDAGTACTYNVGTSGGTVPLLNTANTWSALQTFSNVTISSATLITGLPAPVNNSDAATKAYVDSLANGLNILASSGLATTTVLPNSPTYSNGALGVGATLTAGSNTTLTVDGTAAPLNTAVLVKNQASAFQNGIYTVTQAGSGAAPWILTRATYFDQAAEMLSGSYTLITGGATLLGSSWTLQNTVATVGTDPLNWAQFASQSGVTSVGGNTGIVTNAQVTASCNLFTGALSGCVPSGSGTTSISYLNPATQAWTTPTALVVQSRTAAAALNLTGVNVVKTLGYASAGDGGGATFKPVVGVPFKDTYITAGTIAGGSGYTNGTYLGVPMGGGVGVGCMARVIVSGGAVTTVDLSGVFCNGYAVGDVLTPLTALIGGTGSGATYTVTTISTPMASFTDIAGNSLQYVVDEGSFPNALQFGAKLDWNGSDGSATNDLNSFKSAMAFLSTTFGSASAIVNGGTLIVPKGAAYLCASPAQFATLQVPNGVTIKGAGVYGGTTLRQCSTADSGEHFMSLCDPNSQFGQFGCKLQDLALITPGGTSAGIAAVYSNSGQQFPLLQDVYIQPSGRQCVKYEIGKGGAANAIFNNVDCERADSTTNVGFSGNSSGTQIVLNNWVFGCAPSNCANGIYAVNMIAGNFIMTNVHVEQHVTPVNVATTSTSNLSVAKNWTLTSGCVNGFTIQGTNPNNTFLVENIESSCSTATVLNGHGGGANVTGHILAQRVFNP